MAATISTSVSPEDIWMIKNAAFERFIGLVMSRYPDDKELSEQLKMANITNGVSLDLLNKNAQELAPRLAMALRTIASEVASGGLMLFDEGEESGQEMGIRYQKAFAELVAILDRWKPLGIHED